GTLVGPVIGAWLIKYFENIFSSFNASVLNNFYSFLPDSLRELAVTISGKFVGEGWHLTLGLVFVLIVVFLPGGIMEGIRRLGVRIRRMGNRSKNERRVGATAPAE
ncbi:MAG TPA: branched-chain amino acid ABC transporter permease, partial [Pseudorhizobium sp.]|nr:branched-chain amino acid ABC transporter permease [Pseudorhizobium sp.]